MAASVSLWVMTAAAQDESRPDEKFESRRSQFRRFLRLGGAAKVQPRRRDIAFLLVRGGGEALLNDVIKTDPSCAMGYWGIAMSNWYPLWSLPSAEELSVGS